MSKTYSNPGHKLDWLNDSGSDVVNDQMVAAGSIVGIADDAIVSTEEGVLSVDGVHYYAKSAEDQPFGTKLYFDESENKLTTNSGSGNNNFAGTVVESGVLSADAEVAVKLNWPG